MSATHGKLLKINEKLLSFIDQHQIKKAGGIGSFLQSADGGPLQSSKKTVKSTRIRKTHVDLYMTAQPAAMLEIIHLQYCGLFARFFVNHPFKHRQNILKLAQTSVNDSNLKIQESMKFQNSNHKNNINNTNNSSDYYMNESDKETISMSHDNSNNNSNNNNNNSNNNSDFCMIESQLKTKKTEN